MEAQSGTLYSLLLISGMALVIPILLHKFRPARIPVVVGEIVCGLVVGRTGFNLIDPGDPFLNLLSLLGFTYLMFLGGMEINFSQLGLSRRVISKQQKSKLSSPLVLGGVIFAMTFAMSYVASLFLMRAGYITAPTSPMILAALLSTTSVGVVVPTLKESRDTESPYGQSLLVNAMLADFATILIATILILFLTPGQRGSELLAISALCAVFFFVYRAGARFMAGSSVSRLYSELTHTSAQLRIRTAFALMLLFAMLSSIVGVEIVLGAFLAGAVYRLVFHSTGLTEDMKLDAVGYGFLIPIFFIMVGVKLDLPEIWHRPELVWLILLLLLIAFAVKLVPSMLLSFRFGARNAAAGGFILSSRLSLIIAFAEVAVGAGLLQEELEAVSVMIAIVTCLVSPMLFLALRSNSALQTKTGIIILGAGKVGRLLGERLADRHHSVALLDINAEAVKKTRRLGLKAILYDKLSKETLRQAGAENTGVFVAVTSDDTVNFDACVLARKTFHVRRTVARVGNPLNINLFIENDIVPMNTALASVIALENLMYRPLVYSLLSHEQEGTEVIEVEVLNPDVVGRRIKDIPLPGDALVLTVKKDGLVTIPHGQTVLEKGNSVSILLTESSLLNVARTFDPERPDHQIRYQDI